MLQVDKKEGESCRKMQNATKKWGKHEGIYIFVCMKRLLELTDIEIRMGFAASCVETAAKQAGYSYQEMYRRMKRVGLINNYILRHYEVIHTESRENITADILQTLSNWEASRGITAPKDPNLYLQQEKGGDVC